MSKKDFVAIASAICNSSLDRAAKIEAARALLEPLAKANPRFDRKRFVDACLGR